MGEAPGSTEVGWRTVGRCAGVQRDSRSRWFAVLPWLDRSDTYPSELTRGASQLVAHGSRSVTPQPCWTSRWDPGLRWKFEVMVFGSLWSPVQSHKQAPCHQLWLLVDSPKLRWGVGCTQRKLLGTSLAGRCPVQLWTFPTWPCPCGIRVPPGDMDIGFLTGERGKLMVSKHQ